jgi:hypothetical protein
MRTTKVDHTGKTQNPIHMFSIPTQRRTDQNNIAGPRTNVKPPHDEVPETRSREPYSVTRRRWEERARCSRSASATRSRARCTCSGESVSWRRSR